LAGFAGPAFAADWFVAPSSSEGGNGTRDNPWDIQTALSHPSVVNPGDTIWLRGGTYPGIFLSKLTGTAESPIIVRNYNSESVTLDANVRTTLAQPINSTTTSITLTDAAAITPRVWMWLLLDDGSAESAQITGISGNTITVKRGQNGSAASAHAAGISVRPAIDASLVVSGGYTWFWGLEFTNTDLSRVNAVAGSNPFNRRNGGIDVNSAPGVRIINCVLHDLAGGFGVWKTAADFVSHGNIFYNNGWDSPDRLHGHAIYTQNETPSRLFSDNITWSSFMNTINQYGSSNAALDNITWEGNVLYGGKILFGGGVPVRNLTLRENFFYDISPEFGFNTRENDGLTLEGNYFPLPIYLKWWKNVKSSGNTIFRRDYSCAIDMIFDTQVPTDALRSYKFTANRYYYSDPSPIYLKEWPTCWRVSATGAQGNQLFSEWQALGQDVDSTVTMVPTTMSSGKAQMVIASPVIFLRKNDYDANRSHVIIYNWDRADTVTVPAKDLSGFLQTGEKYRLINVQDYFGDRELGTYDGNGLKVAMTGRSVVKPIGYDEVESWYNGPPPVKTTFPDFGVFVLEILAPFSTPIPPPGSLRVVPTSLP
jgi:hypothetical protein